MGKVYHLDVGCANATIIQTDLATFLVDCHGIENYSHLLPPRKNIRGVFITHQHNGHDSGLKYLLENDFTVDFLLFSPYKRKPGDGSVSYEEWDEFNYYKDQLAGRGTKLYSPYRQSNLQEPFWSSHGAKFFILGPDESIVRSETSMIHDACLVISAKLGERTCVFTGDASDLSLEFIANHTNDFCNDILHASHHGSIQGAEPTFIQKANPAYTVISTKAGVDDAIPHPEALQRYKTFTREAIYRTDESGTIPWEF